MTGEAAAPVSVGPVHVSPPLPPHPPGSPLFATPVKQPPVDGSVADSNVPTATESYGHPRPGLIHLDALATLSPAAESHNQTFYDDEESDQDYGGGQR